MRSPRSPRHCRLPLTGIVCGLTLFAGGLLGCETFDGIQWPGMAGYSDSKREATTATYRERYLSTRDPEHLAWLLRKRLEVGMSLGEVEQILGEQGERQFNDVAYKNSGAGIVRSGDASYKWGPTSDGTSVILFFRDKRLINYDPEEYADHLIGFSRK